MSQRKFCATCQGQGVDETMPGTLVACPDCCGLERLVSINIRCVPENSRRALRRRCLDAGITMEAALVKIIQQVANDSISIL